jgi:hypothetical protein
LNLHHQRFVDEARIASVVGSSAHRDLVRRVAEESITVAVNNGFFPTTARKVGRIVHVSIQKNENDAAPAVVAAKLTGAFPGLVTFVVRPNVHPDIYAQAIKAASGADTVVVSLFHARTALPEQGRAFVAELIRAKPTSTVVVTYGNPYLLSSVRSPAAFVIGYGEGGFFGNQTVYADAFIRLLKGEITPTGRLPVRVPTASL